jgi:hypothetical protein
MGLRYEDVFPADASYETDIVKASVEHQEDGYIHLTFTDDLDDAFSEPQIIKIHKNDLPEFVSLMNTALKWM